MQQIIWWVGAVHLAAYGVAGSLFTIVALANWSVRKARIGGAMMCAYLEYLKRTRDGGRAND